MAREEEARAVSPPYAGLVTRTIAFALDAALVDFVALVVGVVLGLGLSILHLPAAVRHVLEVLGGVAWVLWCFSYFGFFWSTTGRRPETGPWASRSSTRAPAGRCGRAERCCALAVCYSPRCRCWRGS